MTDRDDTGGSAKTERALRLADALRANLRRRKAQARSRRAGEADGRGGLPAATAEAGAVKAPESAGESSEDDAV